jgi:hypothetical protein
MQTVQSMRSLVLGGMKVKETSILDHTKFTDSKSRLDMRWHYDIQSKESIYTNMTCTDRDKT